MTCPSRERWELYIMDSVHETERMRLEEHLYTCANCLETYVSTVEGTEPDTSMIRLAKGPVAPASLPSYVIAASITLLLVFTGGFEWLISTEAYPLPHLTYISDAFSWWDKWIHEGGFLG